MKKFLLLSLCIGILLSMAACNKNEQPAPTGATTPTSSAQPEDPTMEPTVEPTVPPDVEDPAQEQLTHAVALPKVKDSIYAEDGTELFTLSYPEFKLSLRDTAVADIITGNLKDRMGSALSSASDVKTMAQNDFANSAYWTPYFVDISFTPTRVDQAVLSLFGNRSTYSGGPHPNLGTESVTYDMKTGIVLSIVDVMESNCNGQTLTPLLLEALEPMESELFYDYDLVIQEQFTDSFSGISQWYFSRTGLCFHFSPYEIAPYSSGTIIAEVPYEKLDGILLEKYMPKKADNANGSMYGELYASSDDQRFTYVSDVKVDQTGMPVVLYSDAPVTNLRIEAGTWYADGSQFVATSTVFAADILSVGSAIKLTADFENSNTALQLIYRSGDQEISAFIMLDENGESVVLAHG